MRISRGLANSVRPISIWKGGKPLLDLHGGFRDARREQPWTADTLVLIWSATKGLGAACLLHALQEHKIDIDRRVAEFWPEFAQAGKDEITLAQLLSHQAGLAALDKKVDVLDYAAVIRALEKQKPLWPPGTAHGYHARTFGFLLDELMRRIALTSVGEYWRRIFGDPLALDIWIGLPEEQNHRAATIYAAKAGGDAMPAQFYRDLADARNVRSQSVHFTGGFAFGRRDELRRNACTAFRFFRRNWQRVGAGEILRDARKWRAYRWPEILCTNHNQLDDDDACVRNGSRLSNSYGVFCRLHERFAQNIAADFWTIVSSRSVIPGPAAVMRLPIPKIIWRLPT